MIIQEGKTMRIIDIHAHIYQKVAGITKGQPMSSTRLGRVMIGNQEIQFLPPSFGLSNSTDETLIAYMDWCGIEKALLMPNPYYGYHNDYFKSGIKKYPDRFKGVALVDILKGEAAAKELAEIYDEGILFGFKIEVDSTFQCSLGKRMTDKDLAPVWDCCNQYHQPVFIHMFRDCDVKDLEVLVKSYRQITFIICHMGADACFLPTTDRNNFNKVLQIVKENDNAYIDTSTVPVYFTEEYPFPSSVVVIEKAYRTVGPEKLMWASDYPGMLNHATLKQLINLVLNGCTNIPYEHKEMIMGGNANRLFWNITQD
jgi:predicted TIM-barrel fold metal-dependent hydrolase